MKAKRGQVALYLVLTLVAITVLVLMNVGDFLAVTAKNRAMNAGDAVALAVAGHQRDLLNRIGEANLRHLGAVLDRSRRSDLPADERERLLEEARKVCRETTDEQRRLCFFGPLDGIVLGNDWARRNGITLADPEAEEVLRQHVIDIRTGYQMAPEQFPEPWEGAWAEYATALETALGNELLAAPDNIDFIDAAGGHLLLNAQFYNAIAGRNWCWFHFHAPGVLERYSSFRDWGPLPAADDATRLRRSCNSEIYSLHLELRVGSALDLFGVEGICRLTGCDAADVRDSVLVGDPEQVWFFYDSTDSGLWRKWWEIDPEGNAWNEGFGLPVMGTVKPEYDVRGCAAVCRVMNRIPDVVFSGEARANRWTAAAKPFGLVLDGEGNLDENGLVLPRFDAVRLVPWDSVGGRDEERPDLSMVNHVRHHVCAYLENGVSALSSGCFHCDQLRWWERESNREEARRWLKYNAGTCRRPVGSGHFHGGTAHGH